MAISDYASLKTAVGDWIARTDLTNYLDDFIKFGENRIYGELRLRCMEASLSSVISSGVIAIPSDYIELKNAYLDASPIYVLEKKPSEWIYRNFPLRSADSIPIYIAEDAGNYIFGPFPDSGYTVKGTYYKRLTALSASNTTNWFTTNAPDILLFACLCEAEPFIKNDQRLTVWENKYQQVKSRLELAETRSILSGSTLSVSAG